MQGASRGWVRSAGFVAAATLLLGCGGSERKGPAEPAANSVVRVLESLRVQGGAAATLRAGSVPTSSGGPAAIVVAGDAIAQGGTSEVTISSVTEFRKVFVSVAGREGFYEITLPASVTTTTLLATFGTTESGNVTVNYAVGTAAGAVGAATTADVNIVDVGTGDVQVSLSWNSIADVDLHVVDPSGEEIYYSNRTSASGGELDLDSNVGCVDEARAENVTWDATPPRGTFIVRVDYYEECGVASTDYVVTVRRKGQAPQTFTGTFTGLGTGGGEGDGRLITNFTY